MSSDGLSAGIVGNFTELESLVTTKNYMPYCMTVLAHHG